MQQLNLPSFDVRLGGTRKHPTIWDMLRRKYVALTPEEWVRQHFVHFLIDHRAFPASLLANEVSLSMGDKQMRADTVVYDNLLQPRMIIEYKAPAVALSRRVTDQVSTYNLLVHVDYLVVSNGLEHYCMLMDYESHSYRFLEDIPPYEDICPKEHP